MADLGSPYLRAMSGLLNLIKDGEVGVGGRLPAETALAERFGVSVPTVRRALSSLREKGLIESRQGLGSFLLRPATPEDGQLSDDSTFAIARHFGRRALDGLLAQGWPDSTLVAVSLAVSRGARPPYLSVYDTTSQRKLRLLLEHGQLRRPGQALELVAERFFETGFELETRVTSGPGIPFKACLTAWTCGVVTVCLTEPFDPQRTGEELIKDSLWRCWVFAAEALIELGMYGTIQAEASVAGPCFTRRPGFWAPEQSEGQNWVAAGVAELAAGKSAPRGRASLFVDGLLYPNVARLLDAGITYGDPDVRR